MALDLAMDLFFNLGTPERQCDIYASVLSLKFIFGIDCIVIEKLIKTGINFWNHCLFVDEVGHLEIITG